MQRRAIISLLASLALAPIASGNSLAQEEPVTLRIASAFDQNTDMMVAAQRFADLVKERSEGSIDV